MIIARQFGAQNLVLKKKIEFFKERRCPTNRAEDFARKMRVLPLSLLTRKSWNSSVNLNCLFELNALTFLFLMILSFTQISCSLIESDG